MLTTVWGANGCYHYDQQHEHVQHLCVAQCIASLQPNPHVSHQHLPGKEDGHPYYLHFIMDALSPFNNEFATRKVSGLPILTFQPPQDALGAAKK